MPTESNCPERKSTSPLTGDYIHILTKVHGHKKIYLMQLYRENVMIITELLYSTAYNGK
ncbi:hypothetical protein [Aquibacillus kalidii]|uniref:hypothetical protein n=1 Tax=Aquibacillus kalidii TaxID=2762597 RepID=UPI001644EF98|nr:hypothetical protein [Aquibacillus kalidii]